MKGFELWLSQDEVEAGYLLFFGLNLSRGRGLFGGRADGPFARGFNGLVEDACQ